MMRRSPRRTATGGSAALLMDAHLEEHTAEEDMSHTPFALLVSSAKSCSKRIKNLINQDIHRIPKISDLLLYYISY